MANKKFLMAVGMLMLLAAACWFATIQLVKDSPLPEGEIVAGGLEERSPSDAAQEGAPVEGEGRREAAVSEEVDDQDREAPKTPEELKAEAEEAAIEAFDALTDKWMEPAKQGVTMAEVEAFVAQFSQVPTAHREECLQRALNLVPDENILLLAGILLDRSQPQELVELVFNDILNRDEAVKKPILQQVFKDKSHPCWADAAWILEATDETPEKTTAEP